MRDDDVRRDVMCVSTGAVVQLLQAAVQLCVCVYVSSISRSVTEDEAQDALLGAVSARCCYGQTAAREMDIYQIISSCALHVSQCFVSHPPNTFSLT